MDMFEALENYHKAKVELSKHYGSTDVVNKEGLTMVSCGDCGTRLLQLQDGCGFTSDTPLIHCGKIRI